MKKQKTIAKAVRTGLAATLAASMLAVCLPHQYALAASISVDGSSSDWSGISTEAGTTGQVSKWSATADKSNVYLLVTGPKDSQWGVSSAGDFSFSTASGTVTVKPNAYGSPTDANWGTIAGSNWSCANNENGYVYECAIPLSFFSAAPQSVSYCGSSVALKTASDSSGKNTSSTGKATQGASGKTSDASGSTKPSGNTVTGNITVDGASADWGGVPAQTATAATNGIDSWKVARDANGNVYLLGQGTASSQWDSNYQWTNVGILKGGSTINNPQLAGLQWNGGSFASVNEANGNTAGPFTAEAMIPASMLSSADAISFLGTTVKLSEIPLLDGTNYVPSDKPSAYNGITIDGSFDDWAAVSKTDASCPNSAHPNCLSSTAMVFDGDNVYIYIKEGAGGSAAGAGSHGNGLYAITTDLGRTLTFQLDNDGTVSVNAPEAATASHVGSQWEICIPASDLPNYLETINFGLYQEDPFITGVSNLNGKGSGGSFSGITIDGQYSDWAYYPHNTIEYATAGTQSNRVDSEAALWADNSTLYGHVETAMPAHLGSEGGDFLAAVSIAFNGDRDYKQTPSDGNFYPKFYTVDDQGNITVLNEGSRLPQGTSTVYIADTRTDFSSRNYNDLRDDEKFGKMIVTVSGDKMDAEFDLDLNKVGAYIGQDPNSLKTIEIQWGRLGQQWTSISGTSTAPFAGVGLCCAAVAGTLLYRRRKNGASAAPAEGLAATGSAAGGKDPQDRR